MVISIFSESPKLGVGRPGLQRQHCYRFGYNVGQIPSLKSYTHIHPTPHLHLPTLLFPMLGGWALHSPGLLIVLGKLWLEKRLAQGQRGHCRLLSFLPEQPFVMRRHACGVETCKGARLSGLNFSQLLQGDQDVDAESYF